MSCSLTAWTIQVDQDGSVRTVAQHPLVPVTQDSWDLDISWTMSPQRYDAAQWAEGQALLAELIHCDVPARTVLTAAAGWYTAAAVAAQHT